MLIRVLDNNQLPTWSLTNGAVQKYLPDHAPATNKGSIKRQWQGIRSTRKDAKKILAKKLDHIEMERDFYPPPREIRMSANTTICLLTLATVIPQEGPCILT